MVRLVLREYWVWFVLALVLPIVVYVATESLELALFVFSFAVAGSLAWSIGGLINLRQARKREKKIHGYGEY